jgi:signal transduction histidine kinase
MSRRPHGSLRSRLTWQLVAFQALAICVVAAAGTYALMRHFGVDGRVVRPETAEIIVNAVERRGDGTLGVARTAAMQELRVGSPGLWFVVADETGGRYAEGSVPSQFAGIAADLALFGSGSIPSFDGERSAILRLAETGIGRVHVMVGGGDTLSIWWAGATVALRAVIPIVLAVAFVAFVAVAWIIRREFRGVERAAGLAATIDAGRRGARLPETGLPAEIQPLVSAVNTALGRLDEGYARQRRFLADAAHELKTPIAILTTRIETSPAGPERDRRLLLDIARLGNLAEQLLDTQRLDHSPALFTPVDLVDLARQVAGDMAPLAIDAGYELDFDTARPSYVVRGDRPALERVAVNLLQNAIAHGGRRGRIGVAIDIDGALVVSDEGAGVAPEDRDRVFEPFYRATPSDRGAGLGLSIVGDIVARHGGRISVGDGRPGAAFRVQLPQADSL